jgi:hypothetical protein
MLLPDRDWSRPLASVPEPLPQALPQPLPQALPQPRSYDDDLSWV